jgi:hypothetical protein
MSLGRFKRSSSNDFVVIIIIILVILVSSAASAFLVGHQLAWTEEPRASTPNRSFPLCVFSEHIIMVITS